VSLLDDQRCWLARFVALVRDERPDAVLVAGDIYDRALPPGEAVALLDETVSAIVRELETPVLIVAGNHDSPERVGFGSRVFDAAGLHVAGVLDNSPRSVVLGEGDAAVRFWLLPYADPIETRAALGDATVHDHEAAVTACVEQMHAEDCDEPLQILVTHHFVAGGIESESERHLTVGGTGAVSARAFDGFDYVALGHLHRRQSIDAGRIHYPGSALAYAFDESGAEKTVSLVTIEPGSAPIIEHRALGNRRAVRRIEGTFEATLEVARADGAPDDYIEVILDEVVMPPDALGRIREHYPNLLHLTRRLELIDPASEEHEQTTRQLERLSDDERFERFFAYVTGDELADDEHATLHELLSERDRESR
jgi:exonuclease SbcD